MNPINPQLTPRRIVCLTEESVETLFGLGQGHLIVGVSAYVKRPPEALKIPKVSVFTHAQIQKIKNLRPDLVLGFSDIQKDIAKELIGEGLNVFIANHRTIEEILSYIILLGSMVGKRTEAEQWVDQIKTSLDNIHQKAQKLTRRPKVYFEEWDDPMISGIRWVSELIELCGGKDIAQNQSQGVLAKDRFISSEQIIKENPDLILGCWCGKKVDLASYLQRPGWENLTAVQKGQLFELEPEIFLQPGPAVLIDGAPLLHDLFQQWADIE